MLYDDDVVDLVHAILCHSASGIRCDVLQRSMLTCSGRNYDGMVHRAVLYQGLLDLDYRRVLLTDRNIDAYAVLAVLVDHGIYSNRCLACLTVSDDQLSLAPSYREHRVDLEDTRFERSVYRLSVYDGWGRRLDRHVSGGFYLSESVDRDSE